MSIDLSELGLVLKASDGENWLIRVADALEAGKMPDAEDIERIVDAALLLRVQIKDDEALEERRAWMLRKLGFMKAAHREAAAYDFAGWKIAEAYWMDVLWNGHGATKALKAVAEEMNCSAEQVALKRDQHIDRLPAGPLRADGLMKGVMGRSPALDAGSRHVSKDGQAAGKEAAEKVERSPRLL